MIQHPIVRFFLYGATKKQVLETHKLARTTIGNKFPVTGPDYDSDAAVIQGHERWDGKSTDAILLDVGTVIDVNACAAHDRQRLHKYMEVSAGPTSVSRWGFFVYLRQTETVIEHPLIGDRLDDSEHAQNLLELHDRWADELMFGSPLYQAEKEWLIGGVLREIKDKNLFWVPISKSSRHHALYIKMERDHWVKFRFHDGQFYITIPPRQTKLLLRRP